jgi:hypothetical protein
MSLWKNRVGQTDRQTDREPLLNISLDNMEYQKDDKWQGLTGMLWEISVIGTIFLSQFPSALS